MPEQTKEQVKDIITAHRRQTIHKAAVIWRAALAGKEADKIKSASDDLSRALQKIGAEIYEKVASKPGEEKGQQAPPPPGAQASGEGDKVVDAEYREVKDEGSR